MSAKGKWSWRDTWSTARHFVLPVVAVAAVEGLKAINVTAYLTNPVLGAAATGAIATAINAIYRWRASIEEPTTTQPTEQ